VLDVRASHQVQNVLIGAVIAAIEEIAPGAIDRAEATERDKDLEELHELFTLPRD